MTNGVCTGTHISAKNVAKLGKTLKGVALTARLWSPAFHAGPNSKSKSVTTSKSATAIFVRTVLQKRYAMTDLTEVVVYWSCTDPEKFALGREYTNERAALQGARIRNEYVVRVSYSLCTTKVLRTPTKEEKKSA